MHLTFQRDSPVQDYISFDLKILFVGCNPGIESGRKKSHYAGLSNSFWYCLNNSGLLPESINLSSEVDFECLKYDLGLTNLVERVTPGCNDLRAIDFKLGRKILAEKIDYYKPRIVCFVGMLVYRNFVQDSKSNLSWGLQNNNIEQTLFYVVPSTSGRMARLSREEKLFWFKGLVEYLE